MFYKSLSRIWALLFMCCTLVFAQQKTLSLRRYIDMLEKQHQLSFSFLDGDIAHKRIVLPNRRLAKDEALADLYAKTGLLFTKVNDAYVVVHRPERKELRVRGFVKDDSTQLPIENASIHSIDRQPTLTNEKGYFSVIVPSSTTLTITHLGYKPLYYSVTEGTAIEEVSLVMDRQVNQLEEIAVKHFLTNGLQIRTDRSYQMKPRMTGLLPGLTEPDVLQTLQQLPGIVSIDQSISNISVRSGSHDQNLFLWNGIRLFQTGHFFGLISAFNPNLPHTVTIYKNGTPAMLGESVSGTILIDSPPDQVEQSTSIGSSLINADVNSSFKSSPKTYWQFSGRRSLMDYVNSPVYQRYSERVFQNTKVTNFFADQSLSYRSEEDFRFHDLSGQVKHRFSDRVAISANALWIANQLAVTQQNSLDSISETSELAQMSFATNLMYEQKWTNGHESDLRVSFSRYKLFAEDFYEDRDQIGIQRNQVLDKTLSLRHALILSDAWKLSAGYEWSDIAIKNDEEEAQSLQSQSIAAQLVARYPNLFFTTGLRGIHFISHRRFRAEPRASVSYLFKKYWTITFAAEAKSQAAYQEIQQQQDFFGIETRRWKLADGEETPILRSNQVSIEAQFQKRGWLLRAESFAKQVNDLNSRSQGFQNQFSQVHAIGDYTVKGVELQVQKQQGRFTAWTNFHINDSRYSFPTLYGTRFTNNFETPYAIRWGLLYAPQKWEAAIGGIWYAGRYYTQPNSRIPSIAGDGSLYIDYMAPNSSKLHDNFQLNASLSLAIVVRKSLRFKTGLAIQNMANNATVINRSYRINRNSETIEEIDNYNLARTSNVFIRLYF
ncbi:TonB-dependent receptor [Sphingobacterium griseoflavum]|uniref:TonB-dependent receptor n=2 Tax=Sphingobacterium griseoflavum TaxID=1474952 RepID=A0ABQ3HWP6_9SPHI|nr:TonB-dependent receptor [Sphingobacterium griseoflavum]